MHGLKSHGDITSTECTVRWLAITAYELRTLTSCRQQQTNRAS